MLNLLGTKSLDSILASFTKTKAELETFTDITTVEADKLRAEATEKMALAESKQLEIQKATRVRENIIKILEG